MNHLDDRQRAMLAEMGVRLWARPPAPARPLASSPAHTSAPAPQAPAAARLEAHPLAAPAAHPAPAPAPPRQAPPASPAKAALPSPPPTPEPPVRAPRPAGVDTMDWPALEAAVADCHACGLCEKRRHTVFGVGARQADWMVIGEAPGEQEDRQGQPFVGQAGKLLDAMLAATGLSRHAPAPAGAASASAEPQPVYIANVLKCRPPGNRNPQPEEVAQCEPYLRRQVALVQPRVILAMGRFAVQSLLQTTEPIGRLRGRVHQYAGVPVIVTYHPAYLLRNQPDKAKAWQDLCLAREVMNSHLRAASVAPENQKR
ncbi:MAG: uracil-DNA glycosylase [Comamonadaceae bacterium]|nr:uracil-DNA glycosylase [Comamonadaceae bacterium]